LRSGHVGRLVGQDADASGCCQADYITVISYWLNYGVSFANSDVVWRFPIAFQIVFALIIIGGMMFLPESPRWYIYTPKLALGSC
jgi:hypothetical protein